MNRRTFVRSLMAVPAALAGVTLVPEKRFEGVYWDFHNPADCVRFGADMNPRESDDDCLWYDATRYMMQGFQSNWSHV